MYMKTKDSCWKGEKVTKRMEHIKWTKSCSTPDVNVMFKKGVYVHKVYVPRLLMDGKKAIKKELREILKDWM